MSQSCRTLQPSQTHSLIRKAFVPSGPLRTARRTACGTQLLVGLDTRCPVRNRFVAEHRSERRPGRIERRLSLCSIRQRSALHIADDNQLVLPHERRRCFVQIILSCVGDLGMDCRHAFLVAGALRLRERGLVALEVFRVLDLAAVGQRDDGATILVAVVVAVPAVSFVDVVKLGLHPVIFGL